MSDVDRGVALLGEVQDGPMELAFLGGLAAEFLEPGSLHVFFGTSRADGIVDAFVRFVRARLDQAHGEALRDLAQQPGRHRVLLPLEPRDAMVLYVAAAALGAAAAMSDADRARMLVAMPRLADLRDVDVALLCVLDDEAWLRQHGADLAIPEAVASLDVLQGCGLAAGTKSTPAGALLSEALEVVLRHAGRRRPRSLESP